MIKPEVKVAYLLNQHPYTSCTFIRREIHALEEMGFKIERFSIRPTEHKLVEDLDLQEKDKTRIILSDRNKGLQRLVSSGLSTFLSRPGKAAKALALAVSTGRRSERGLAAYLAYLLEACVVLRWCEETGIGHIHCHFATNPAAVAMLCRVLGGPTYSFTVHGPQEFDLAYGLSFAEKISGAKFVSTISHFAISQLNRWSKFEDWDKINLVRCGVNDAFLDVDTGTFPTEPRLLNIGRLTEQKGQLLLVKAAAELKQRGLKFVVDLVGDGEMRGELERLIEHHGLQDSVRLLGWQNEAQVKDHIQKSRAVVLSSFAEGLPVVLMESLALGRPAISTAIAGVPELIEPGENGWLVPAGSVSHLADAMQEVIEAPVAKLEAMGKAGRERVRRQHHVRTEASKLADLINS